MTISVIDVIALIKDLVSDGDKLAKFREIVADVKELMKDLKDLLGKQ